MQIRGPSEQDVFEEFEVLNRLLTFDGARVLELGCGGAEKTRQIAQNTGVQEIVAAEVDEVQHAKNLAITDLPKVTFKSYGAQAIEEADHSFDIVLLFKSLHHVPIEAMDTGLSEIRRVLKPGGYAYISEPVFAGDFNEVIRLFHDEERVRTEAFDAINRAIEGNILNLSQQYFFKNIVRLNHFGQFEKGILNATHTDHELTQELLDQVKSKFESYRQADGFKFEIENRVDLLQNL